MLHWCLYYQLWTHILMLPSSFLLFKRRHLNARIKKKKKKIFFAVSLYATEKKLWVTVIERSRMQHGNILGVEILQVPSRANYFRDLEVSYKLVKLPTKTFVEELECLICWIFFKMFLFDGCFCNLHKIRFLRSCGVISIIGTVSCLKVNTCEKTYKTIAIVYIM